MDSLYPKLRAGFQAQWAPDGKVLHLYNRKTRQAFRLSRTCGQVLCSLDGQTWPGENTGLSAKKVYQYLRLFAIHGLLEEAGPRVTDNGGTFLWNFPCPQLRTGRPIPVLCLYNHLIEWLWLPLLVATLAVCSLPDIQLPQLDLGPIETTIWLFLCNIPGLILHELAHAAAANALGVPVSSFGFGFQCFLPCFFTMIPLLPFSSHRTCRAVYRAGPLSNLCFGCALLILCLKVPIFRLEPVFLASIGNLILAIVNLLPLEGFDGHGIMRSFPVLERALCKSRVYRSAWERFFATVLGVLLRSAIRVGLFAFILYEALYVLSMLLEVFS